jgi:xanthine dehydrogenase accessory factor
MLDDERLPAAVRRVPGADEDTLRQAAPEARAFVVVMTRGHHDDQRVLAALAAAGGAPRFLGMIGSRSKRAVLLGRLAAQGVPAAWLERVVSPVGLPIGARTAQEIAVSIVAQLIAEARGGGRSGGVESAAAGSGELRAAHAPP